jgi:hypothetical protein
MLRGIFKKGLIFGIIMMFVGTSVVSSIERSDNEIVLVVNNRPPIIKNATPINDSTNNSLSLSWSILIFDREGDAFSWTIQCSNRQNASGIGASNGTKSLVLSGLTNSSSYKVWVNATDPAGSGLWTRRWYTFTTIKQTNHPPDIPSNPSPPFGADSVDINTSLSWTGSDPDIGDTVTYDVWFGSMFPLQKVASNISTTSFNPGTLFFSLTYWWRVVAWDNHGMSTEGSIWVFTTLNPSNNPPNKPSQPSGKTNGEIGREYSYTTSTTDPDGDKIYYLWDWDDGNNSGWLGPYNSGFTINTTHNWAVKGLYSIKVKAKDIHGHESNWSDPLPITMPYLYRALWQFLELLFQRFPNAFPILRHLLGY